MSRQIRVGDTVQGFLRPEVKGKVIGFDTLNNNQVTVGATASGHINLCIVRVEKSGQEIAMKLSEVFIVDY